MKNTLNVTKRNGTLVPVCLQEIQNKITNPALEDPVLEVDPARVAIRVCESLTNDMSTSEIDIISAESCMEFYTAHTDYETLAVRIILDDMNKTYKCTFSECMSLVNETGRLSDAFYET
eukprot:3622808-Prymnesium_polylepis.1